MMKTRNELQRIAYVNAILGQNDDVYRRTKSMQQFDKRMADMNMMRLRSIIRREIAFETEASESVKHKKEKEQSKANEVNLAREIARVKKEEYLENVQAQRATRDDPRMRDFISKLTAAYNAKDLHAQIKYNKNKKIQDKLDDASATIVLEDSLSINDPGVALSQARKQQYRQDLQQQMIMKDQAKRHQYEKTLIEERMDEGIAQATHEEDLRALEAKRLCRGKLRREMSLSEAASAAWGAAYRKKMAEEDLGIEKQRAAIRSRNDALVAARKAKVEARAKMAAHIGAKMEAAQAEKLARTNIIEALWEQEGIEKGVTNVNAGVDKAARDALLWRQGLRAQLAERKRLAQEEQAKRLDWRKMNEENIHRAKEQKRSEQRIQREKQKQYATALVKQIAESNAKRQKEREWENSDTQNIMIQKKKNDVFKHERSKLLEEHAPKVLGYLRPGVLEPEELALLKEKARKP